MLRASTPLSLAAIGLGLGLASPAAAQSSACQEIQKILSERKSIVDQINALGGKKKQVDATKACAVFGRLTANGAVGLKFLAANKDWCNIPDQFAVGFKADHDKVSKVKSQACGAAAKQADALKKAKQQAAQQQAAQGSGGPPTGGMLGGPGLTGQFKVPQGAL